MNDNNTYRIGGIVYMYYSLGGACALPYIKYKKTLLRVLDFFIGFKSDPLLAMTILRKTWFGRGLALKNVITALHRQV